MMFNPIRSLLGWKEDTPQTPTPSPPPVTFTAVRIPADGTPAHLLSLSTVNDPGATTGFLFRVPNVHAYWTSEFGWQRRDLQRLDLLQRHDSVPHAQYAQLKEQLQTLLLSGKLDANELLHLRQRNLRDHNYHVLRQQHHESCLGVYYILYSFDVESLPQNTSAPAWIRSLGDGHYMAYWGDVFIVKMAEIDSEKEQGWAVYQDIDPEFLNLLNDGPDERKKWSPRCQQWF